MHVFLTEWLVNFPLVDNGGFFVALERIGRFCFSPSVFLKTKSYLLVFVSDEQPGKKDFPAIWPLLVDCKQTLYSKLLHIFGHLFRTLQDGKIVDQCSFSSPWRVLLSLSVNHSKYSSPLASSFLKTISPNFICLGSCLARWPKWRMSKNHIVRERTSGSWMPN